MRYSDYLAGVPGTAERMIAAAQNLSSMHRAAVAWAMGYTRDDVFRTRLDELSRDPEENVRTAAASALGRYVEAALEKAAG